MMKEKKDILDDITLKGNPYSVRDGYFDYIGSRVNDKIGNPAPSGSIWTILKPALLMACMFGIIFGVGYATFSLTNTIDRGPQSQIVAEQESFESFMEDLHNSDFDSFNSDGSITDEEMFEFVSEYYSTQYIESYFADAQ